MQDETNAERLSCGLVHCSNLADVAAAADVIIAGLWTPIQQVLLALSAGLQMLQGYGGQLRISPQNFWQQQSQDVYIGCTITFGNVTAVHDQYLLV